MSLSLHQIDFLSHFHLYRLPSIAVQSIPGGLLFGVRKIVCITSDNYFRQEAERKVVLSATLR